MDNLAEEDIVSYASTDDGKPKPDTGLHCLVMLAQLHAIAVDPDQLAHKFKVDGQPFSKSDILLASKQLGLKARAVKASPARLDRTPLPALAIGDDGLFLSTRSGFCRAGSDLQSFSGSPRDGPSGRSQFPMEGRAYPFHLKGFSRR